MSHASPLSPVSGWGSALAQKTSRHRNSRSSPPGCNEVTNIIPLDEFGRLDDGSFTPGFDFGDCGDLGDFGDFGDGTGADYAAENPVADNPPADHLAEAETQLLSAPELDDLHDIDNLAALRLSVPTPVHTAAVDTVDHQHRHAELSGLTVQRGRHRSQQIGAVRGRVLIGAMAAGAALAGGYAATHPSGTVSAQAAPPTADPAPATAIAASTDRGMQMVTVKAAANVVVHNEELAKGMAFAQERAEREARLQRPLFVMPTRGIFTSSFGYRWGVLHGGIDIANSIGTPILAASDGVVIEAGATAGYGMLVKVRHFDGTVTLYGHVNNTTVSVGERVMAGDQIATMGNRGYSTGPHLHFEVLLGGTSRVDPTSWLAQRGVNFGA